MKGAKSDWRVMARKGDLLSLLRSDRRDPFYEKDVPIESIERDVRERVAVRSIDGTASTICRFGEPGAVGGPGHQLLFRPGLGVTMFTARELWRLQGAEKGASDARFDSFVTANPTSSYEDLAGAAGDAIAAPWAAAVINRSVDRSVLLVGAAQRRLAAWARERASASRPSP